MQNAFNPHSLEAHMAEILSDKQFPIRWYQRDGTEIGFAILTTLLGYLSIFLFAFQPPFPVRLISILFVMVSAAADSITTYRAFALQQAFAARGLEFPIRESNPLMADSPAPREIFLGKPRILVAIAIGFTLFIPLAGWGIAGILLTVSLNNHRNRQQAQYELRLYDTMTSKGWEKKQRYPVRSISGHPNRYRLGTARSATP